MGLLSWEDGVHQERKPKSEPLGAWSGPEALLSRTGDEGKLKNKKQKTTETNYHVVRAPSLSS